MSIAERLFGLDQLFELVDLGLLCLNGLFLLIWFVRQFIQFLEDIHPTSLKLRGAGPVDDEPFGLDQSRLEWSSLPIWNGRRG